jgi:hypothetical protein
MQERGDQKKCSRKKGGIYTYIIECFSIAKDGLTSGSPNAFAPKKFIILLNGSLLSGN